MPAEEEVELAWDPRCTVRDCVCSWRSYCSPWIPRVGPGMDYVCIPAGADHGPAWSLLVGVRDGAVLRLKRLRVARSGRILGRSDDKLEAFHDLAMLPTEFDFASAALAPDGRSLCVLSQAHGEQPQALQLTLQPQTGAEGLPLPATKGIPSELHLPEIEETSRCVPISAAGHIWALYITAQHIDSFSVNARRLVPGGQWEQVGDAFTSPYIRSVDPRWDGEFLQGYAVLPGFNLILVSFKQNGLFFTFAPDSGTWTPVLTDAKRLRDYVPILGRGVYIEQDDAVCMLRDNTVYAYKLSYLHDDDQGTQRQLRLDPPITVDSVCPFNSCRGYGFLTRLDGRLMCSVWISVAWREPCPCDYLHAFVTTFHLRDLALGGIEVLHSSHRRVDMEPNPADQVFCFLQEYEDTDYPVPPQEDLASSQDVDEPLKLPNCCRWLLYPASLQRKACFSSRHVVPLKPATTTIKKDLFIVCQAGPKPVIYQTGVVDDESFRLEGDGDKPLQPCYVADDGDEYWHFFHSGLNVHAVSCIRDGMLEFSMNKDRTTMIRRLVRRPSSERFAVVIRVGGETVAITETLQVFHQTGFSTGSPMWSRYKTDQSHALFRRVMITGYVALNDHSFIVYDKVTCSCLLFDLDVKQWRVVMPWAAFDDVLPRKNPTNCFLNGRCVFVDGFIYTCRNEGLAAYQLLGKDHCVYLSNQILLPLSEDIEWVGANMCLDYAGKDAESGAILFYVVQGGYCPPKHDLHITIVQVKTKSTPSNKRIPMGVNCVDCVKRFILNGETLDARCCFAVSCV